MVHNNSINKIAVKKTILVRVCAPILKNKTVSVTIEQKLMHPLYGKFIRTKTKLLVHDEENIANVGDIVTIVPTRPISKKKSWVIVRG